VILSNIGMSVSIILLVFTISFNDYWFGKISAEDVNFDGKSKETHISDLLTYYPYGHKDRNLKVASDLTGELVDITHTCAVRITTKPDILAVCDRFFRSYTLLIISFYTKNEPAISQIVSPMPLHIPSEDLAVKNGSSEIGTVSNYMHRSEDISNQLLTIWSACTDKGLSICNDIAGEFVTSINSLLIDGAEDIKEIMTEEKELPKSIPRGVALHFELMDKGKIENNISIS
jgi:hypothetical protein